MSFVGWAITYVAALAAFLIVDLVWLGVVAKPLYSEHMGTLLRDDPRWGVALVFYALYVAGMLFFAVAPVLRGADDGSVWRAMAMGAGFGLVTYATYDLTSLSVIRGFGTAIAVIDIAWGTVLGAIVASIAYAVAGRFG